LKIDAEFVKSAAAAGDLPRDGVPQVAMVGRSNVGKSSLINALVRRAVARTSAAPGKTRLANIYLVARGGSRPFYLVDLPGYGYARGGDASAREFDELIRAYFGQPGRAGLVGQASAGQSRISVVLLVDSRHPGLDRDVEAWRWLTETVAARGIAATKIDKLARGERIRALRELQSVFDNPVVPVSAATGEGLDELWKLIDKLTSSHLMPRNTGPTPPKRAPRQSEPPKNPQKK
jgi:GTP-binding protein